MKFLLFILLVVAQVSCGPLNSPYNNSHARSTRIYDYNSPEPTQGMPTGPGCYAKCLMPNKYASHYIPIIEYTGNKYNDPNIESRRIIIKEAATRWVKKRADKNCLSSNPEDCLVWCLEEVKAEYYDYYEVIDTNIIKQFEISEIEKKELVKEGGYTEWKQVVCDVNIKPQFYSKVKDALLSKGYINEVEYVTTSGFSQEIKNGLVKFQKDNGLPVGQLDIESMKLLGVDY